MARAKHMHVPVQKVNKTVHETNVCRVAQSSSLAFSHMFLP